MFNLKYNFLVGTQIFLNILNISLIMRVFGASAYSDAYLLALSIFGVLVLILLMPVAQFMQFYNELKGISLKKSHDFYNCSLFFSFFVGVVLCIFFTFHLDFVIQIFTKNIDIERFFILKKILIAFLCGLAFYPINAINERLFNAEMRFALPYILQIVPTALVVFTQILMLVFHSYNIVFLAYSQAFGNILVALLGSYYIAKYLIPFKFVKWQDYMNKFIKNSTIMQFGHSFYSITLPVFFNNFLITFPQGYVSYFYYAKKILDITNIFTLGPSRNILGSNISKYMVQKNIEKIKAISKKFLIYGGAIFVIALVIAYYLQKPIIQMITSNKFTNNDLFLISHIFLSLCPWYLIIFCEAPYVSINTQAKKAKSILVINTTFLFIFGILLPFFKPYAHIYAISISLFIAQCFNLFLHQKVTEKVAKNMFKT